MSAKDKVLEDFPTALAIHEPTGWFVYGGIENELEMSAVLACDQPTESDAWEEAIEYYRDMLAEGSTKS